MSSAVRRWTAGSASSSAIRRRAATGSAWSSPADTGQLPGVGEVLTASDVDRLFTGAEVVGNPSDGPAGFDGSEDLVPELGRVTTGYGSLLECLEHLPADKVTPPGPGRIRASIRPGAVRFRREVRGFAVCVLVSGPVVLWSFVRSGGRFRSP